jgi:hypothetical protein
MAAEPDYRGRGYELQFGFGDHELIAPAECEVVAGKNWPQINAD